MRNGDRRASAELKFKALLQKEIKIIAVCPFIVPSPAGIPH